MFKKKKAKKQPCILDTKQIHRLIVPRYTKEVWSKTFPEQKWDYDRLNCTDSLLNSFARTVKTIHADPQQHGDVLLTAIPIGERYLAWLNGKKNTPEAQAAYAKTISEEDRIAELAEHKLNITWHNYVMPIMGVVQGSVKLKMQSKTVDAIRAYVDSVLQNQNFKTYVCPYLLAFPKCTEDEVRIVDMAKTKFEDGIQTQYGMYESQKYAEDHPALTMFSVFVAIKETHPTGEMRICDLTDCEDPERPDFKGRFLDDVPLDGDPYSEDGKIAPTFYGTPANTLLNEELQKIFINKISNETFYPMFVRPNDLPKFCEGLINLFTNDIKNRKITEG